MRQLLLIILLFAGSITYSQNPTLESIRKEYDRVRIDSASCAKLYSKVKKSNATDNLSLAYKGAITASMANFSKVKQEKIALFNEGKKILETAIAKDSSNIELRFLRLTIQSNCPKALGYHKQIQTDKNYIISHFDSLKSSEVKNKIKEFLLSSSITTDIDKKKLKASAQ